MVKIKQGELVYDKSKYTNHKVRIGIFLNYNNDTDLFCKVLFGNEIIQLATQFLAICKEEK